MACLIPAKKSCSSHLFGMVLSRAAQTAFVPELSKAITFCLTSYPGEIGHSNSPNQELSNDVLLGKLAKEKLPIPLEAHHKAQSNEIFLSFLVKNLKSCIFYLLANPDETAYLSFRD